MIFFKIINGELELAPKEFVENGKRIVGFTENFLKKRGYKPVIWSEPTKEEQLDYYKETEEVIIQYWK